LSVSLQRAARSLPVPLVAFVIRIVQHGVLLAVKGGSAICISATDAWAEPLPVMRGNVAYLAFVPAPYFTGGDQGGGKRRTVIATKSHQNATNECNGKASDQEAKDGGHCQYFNGPSSDFCHLEPPNY
jgi:hypothetical protein